MRWSFVFLLWVFLYHPAGAQIVYTDVNPDSTFSASAPNSSVSYFVDLDKDGVFDKELRHFNGGGFTQVEISNYPSPAHITEEITGLNGRAKMLSMGDSIIPSSLTWGHDQAGALDNSWLGQEGYLAVRFSKISGQWFYGWIRVSIPADAGSFTIMDFAYNSTPNMGLLAGQRYSTGISSHQNGVVSARVIGSIIYIISPVDVKYAATLQDVNGAIIKQQWVSGTGVIDASNLPNGLYIITLKTEGDTRTLKVVVNH